MREKESKLLSESRYSVRKLCTSPYGLSSPSVHTLCEPPHSLCSMSTPSQLEVPPVSTRNLESMDSISQQAPHAMCGQQQQAVGSSGKVAARFTLERPHAHTLRFAMVARANVVAHDRLLVVVLCVLATCSCRGDTVVRKREREVRGARPGRGTIRNDVGRVCCGRVAELVRGADGARGARGVCGDSSQNQACTDSLVASCPRVSHARAAPPPPTQHRTRGNHTHRASSHLFSSSHPRPKGVFTPTSHPRPKGVFTPHTQGDKLSIFDFTPHTHARRASSHLTPTMAQV
jgi:hypothetical protein